MNEVKQMLRTLHNVSNPDTGVSSSVEVDYELEQYFARGFELFAVFSAGDFKIGGEVFPRVLYVLTKSDAVVPTVTRGRPKSAE